MAVWDIISKLTPLRGYQVLRSRLLIAKRLSSFKNAFILVLYLLY